MDVGTMVNRVNQGVGLVVSTNARTGVVTITNVDPEVITVEAGAGITFDITGGDVTVNNSNPNPGVTRLIGGNGIEVDGNTVINLNPTPDLISLSAANSTLTATTASSIVTLSGNYTGGYGVNVTAPTISLSNLSVMTAFTSLGGANQTGPDVNGTYTTTTGPSDNIVSFSGTISTFTTASIVDDDFLQTPVNLPAPLVPPLLLTDAYFTRTTGILPNSVILSNVILTTDFADPPTVYLQFWADPLSLAAGYPFTTVGWQGLQQYNGVYPFTAESFAINATYQI